MLVGRTRLVHCLALVVGFSFAAVDVHAGCGDPDPGVVVLQDADIYDVDGGDMVTVIADPFPDNSLIGYYIAVHTGPGYTDEYFRIISNEHFDQWNISVFTVAEDLENVAGSNW